MSVAENDLGVVCVKKKLKWSVKKDLVFERGNSFESK